MKTALDRLEVSLKNRLKDRTLGCSKSFSSMSKYDQALFRSIIRSLGVMGCEDIKCLQGDSEAYRYVSEMLACMNNTRVAKRYKVQYVEYKVNEPTTRLLSYYNYHNSGKVCYARTDLKNRFVALSRNDQIRVVKSFLVSRNKADREWAARQAGIMWDKSFEESLITAFKICPSKTVSAEYFKHAPIELVREASVVCREAELEYHTRLAMEGILPSDADDMDIFKYLIVVSQADRKVHLAEYPIEKKVFAYLYRYINETGCGECHYSHTILGVPLFIKAIEAMGILGMTKLLFVILDMVDYVFEFTANAPVDRQFEMANEWIEDIWEADDKRNILDGYDDDLPLAIKSNEERLSVKRLDKFPISIGDIFNEFL